MFFLFIRDVAVYEPEPFVGHEDELRTNEDLVGWVETATSINLSLFL